jgi:hypothetical protein
MFRATMHSHILSFSAGVVPDQCAFTYCESRLCIDMHVSLHVGVQVHESSRLPETAVAQLQSKYACRQLQPVFRDIVMVGT